MTNFSPSPTELALEQLVFAMVLERLETDPGYFDRLREFSLFTRFGVDTDRSFSDLILTLIGLARKAGL